MDYHFTDGLYDCPWGCPFNIFPEDVEYHRDWHRAQGEDPDKATAEQVKTTIKDHEERVDSLKQTAWDKPDKRT